MNRDQKRDLNWGLYQALDGSRQLTTEDLIRQLREIVVVHPQAAQATVHVAEAGRDEGVLKSVRYKAKQNILILEGDPKVRHGRQMGKD